MPQADIETLRAVYEAISRGDWDAKVQMHITHLWTVRVGRPVRCEVFVGREQALAAAELPE